MHVRLHSDRGTPKRAGVTKVTGTFFSLTLIKERMLCIIEPLKTNTLTAREIEILQLIGQGLGNQEMARRLFLSEKTVKNHLTNIFRKLNVSDRTQAVIYAIKNKIVQV